MARGRLQSQWSQQISVMRSIWACGMQPQEPPLAKLVPSQYLPDNAGGELTDEEKELVKQKRDVDMKIMQSLAGKGIKVKRGTPRD